MAAPVSAFFFSLQQTQLKKGGDIVTEALKLHTCRVSFYPTLIVSCLFICELEPGEMQFSSEIADMLKTDQSDICELKSFQRSLDLKAKLLFNKATYGQKCSLDSCTFHLDC